MPSSKSTLTAFTDAAADAVARTIAQVQREAARERELREAQFAAKMAELDARIAAVAETERRLADRIASVKDGERGEPGRDADEEAVAARVAEKMAGELAGLRTIVTEVREVQENTDLTAIVTGVAKEVVAEAMAEIPVPQDGKSVTLDDVRPMIEEGITAAVAAIPAPKDGENGKDADPAVIRQMVEEIAPVAVSESVRAYFEANPVRDGMDGTSVTLEDVIPIIEEKIAEAVAAIPAPKDGKDGVDGKDGRDGEPGPKGDRGQGIDDIDLQLADDGRAMVLRFTAGDVKRSFEVALPEGPAGRDGVDGAPGERGPEGPEGKLRQVREWEDRVHYAGDVVTYEGGVYQAVRDTGKEPGGDDWCCIVKPGRDGADGRSFTLRGTYSADAEYRALDVVALNGASFAAKQDNPGECPGPGWQLVATQGKAGKPGPKGDRGERGFVTASTVIDARLSDDGVLTLVNSDGTEVQCDFYPILSKIGG